MKVGTQGEIEFSGGSGAYTNQTSISKVMTKDLLEEAFFDVNETTLEVSTSDAVVATTYCDIEIQASLGGVG